VKQKFGTRLTSLLLCLALVAGLLQGLPVAAKAANNHNSIGLGATWLWGETINLGSGVHFWYKEDIGIEEAYETESQNRDSEVLQPDLSSIASKYYWKFTNCIAADNSFVDLYVNVPKDKGIDLRPIGIKIIGGKGTSNDPFYFGPVYYYDITDDAVGKTWYVGNTIDFGSEDFYLYGEPFRRSKDDPDIECFGYGKYTVNEPEEAPLGNYWTITTISHCLHGGDDPTFLRFDAEGNKKPVGITLKADHLGYYFGPVYEHKHDDIEFEAWDSNNSLPDTQGNYYLTKDVLLSSTWNVPGGISMINLCLNNHTIYMENNGDVIQINSGCHLNLFDDGSGTITHANSNGRGVYISGGHFGMYGGTISGNNVLNGNGGGVCIKDILLEKFTGLSPEDILNIVNYLLGLLESVATVD